MATQNKVVFVVDDDPSALSGIARLLKVHGFQAVAFASVEDFCARANARNAGCLVLDIQLGQASGIELKYQLAASGSLPPVIFITGNDTNVTRGKALQAGCVAYLTKPFPGNSFIDAVTLAINRPPCAS